jgi:hypothetical protein
MAVAGDFNELGFPSHRTIPYHITSLRQTLSGYDTFWLFYYILDLPNVKKEDLRFSSPHSINSSVGFDFPYL